MRKHTKIFTIIFAIILLAGIAVLAVGCSDKKGDDQADKDRYIFVDGVESSKIPEEDSYVGYVRSATNSANLHYDYDKKDISKENIVGYSIYLFKVNTLFESVEDLCNNETQFEEGTILGTKRYYADTDRGASMYKVCNEKDKSAMFVKEMKSGQFAELVPLNVGEETIVTVDMLGAYGDGKNYDQVAIQKAMNFKGATTVEFESDIYVQRIHITVSNQSDKTINGRGAEIINDYEKYVVVNNDLVFDKCQNIILENLTMNCLEKKGKNTLYNSADHLQVRVKSCNNFTLDNVKILCPDNSTYDRHVGSIWFSSSNDVVMQNCYIQNLSKSTAYSAGIWVSATEKTSVSGFKLINTYIEKASHDEVLAFFIGTMSDIEIYGNTIYTHDEPTDSMSSHAIGFGVNDIGSVVNNVKFYDNTVDIVSNKDAIHFNTCDNIEIYNNKITLRSNSTSNIVAEGLFRVSEPKETTQTNISIHDNECAIISNANYKNGYNIGNIFANIRDGFTITNNTFKVEGQIRLVSYGSTKATITNNTFDFSNKPINETTIDTSNTKNW